MASETNILAMYYILEAKVLELLFYIMEYFYMLQS